MIFLEAMISKVLSGVPLLPEQCLQFCRVLTRRRNLQTENEMNVNALSNSPLRSFLVNVKKSSVAIEYKANLCGYRYATFKRFYSSLVYVKNITDNALDEMLLSYCSFSDDGTYLGLVL